MNLLRILRRRFVDWFNRPQRGVMMGWCDTNPLRVHLIMSVGAAVVGFVILSFPTGNLDSERSGYRPFLPPVAAAKGGALVGLLYFLVQLPIVLSRRRARKRRHESEIDSSSPP